MYQLRLEEAGVSDVASSRDELVHLCAPRSSLDAFKRDTRGGVTNRSDPCAAPKLGDPGGRQEPLLLLSSRSSGDRLDHSLSVTMVGSEKVWFLPQGLHRQPEREIWPFRSGRVSHTVTYESRRPRTGEGADSQRLRWAACPHTAPSSPRVRRPPLLRPVRKLLPHANGDGARLVVGQLRPRPGSLAAVRRSEIWTREGVNFRDETP